MSTLSLFHHRWTLPVLAAVEQAGGARFVQLARGLGVGRETLRQTLDGLIEAGLVARNPGHGHPLRPEYVPTDRGRRLAPAAAVLLDLLRREGLDDVGLRKWSIPVVLAVGTERRFGELREAVGASPRALSLALRALVDAGLVLRRVDHGYPPSTSYVLTDRGSRVRRAGQALDELVTRESGPAR